MYVHINAIDILLDHCDDGCWQGFRRAANITRQPDLSTTLNRIAHTFNLTNSKRRSVMWQTRRGTLK